MSFSFPSKASLYNTVGPPYPQVLHPLIQLKIVDPGLVKFTDAEPMDAFHIKDLNILGFWYLRGPWNQSPV